MDIQISNLGLGRHGQLDVDVAQLLVVHGGRRVHHQVHGFLRLGEGDDVADAVTAGQQHDEAVGADGEAAVRRRAVFQRADQVAEAALDFGFGQAEELEHPVLEGRVVDPDAAAEHGKNVVVRLDDEQEATFKNLVVEGSRRFLRPLNPDWPEKMIEVNGNATICGVVVGKWVPE